MVTVTAKSTLCHFNLANYANGVPVFTFVLYNLLSTSRVTTSFTKAFVSVTLIITGQMNITSIMDPTFAACEFLDFAI